MSDLRERMLKYFRSSGKYPNGSRGWESCLLDRISELEAIIEAAPHDYFCYAGDPWATGEYNENSPCTCWKSKIGSK